MSDTSSHLRLVIAGIPGSGKTTLAKQLGKILDAKVFLEDPSDNPFFHGANNPNVETQKQLYFKMQMHFLIQRASNQDLMDCYNKPIILDRWIYEDAIFADYAKENRLIDLDEYILYTRFFSALAYKLPKPDLILYLKVDPKIAQQRVQARGQVDQNLPFSYFSDLAKKYEREIPIWSTKVLELDWNYPPTTLDDVISQINKVNKSQQVNKSQGSQKQSTYLPCRDML